MLLLQKPSNVRDTKEREKLSLWDESLTSQTSETLRQVEVTYLEAESEEEEDKEARN